MGLMNKQELLQQLAQLPNSFSWQKEISAFFPDKSNLVRKLEIIDEEFNTFTFSLILILFNKYVEDSELAEAKQLLINFEKIFDYFHKENNDQIQFEKSQKAFWFVFEMCKCHINLMQNSLENANKIFTRALAEVDFNEQFTKAALLGLQADYLIYSEYKDYPRIVKLLEDAINLEPKQHYWHFALGKVLSRRRRLTSRFNIPVDNKEILLLEKAFALRKCGIYAAFLAESLAEQAYQMYINNQVTYQVKKDVENMKQRSRNLIKEALNLDSQLENVNIRCATSLMKLIYPNKDDYHLAEKCLLRAKELNPTNLMANVKLGEFYFKNKTSEESLKIAKQYFKIAADAGIHVVCFQVYEIELQLKEKTFREIISEMKNLIEVNRHHSDTPVINNIYLQLGWAMYLVENNLYEALKYWEHPIKDADKFPGVKSSKFFWSNIKKPFNVLEIVSDEIRLAKESHNYQDSEEEALHERIHQFIKEKYPELLNTYPQKRHSEISNKENIKKWIRHSFY